jgi:hypothetical protein
MFENSCVRPLEEIAQWGRQIYRELNTEADKMANLHKDERHVTAGLRHFSCYRLFFDGSVTPKGAGGGWVLYGATEVRQDAPEEWTRVASVSFAMPHGSTITICELEACMWGVAFVAALFQGEAEAAANLESWKPLKLAGVKTMVLADLLK